MSAPTLTTLDLSVVVPVHNNAGTLSELLDRLVHVLDGLALGWEIVAVDDRSIDASGALLRQRAAADPRIRCVSLRRNAGGQAATCAGFEVARGQRIVTLDADLENLPEDIPTLLAALDGGADLVMGWRDARTDSFLGRRLPSILLNAWIRRRVATQLHDIGCGMRALNASLVHNLVAAGEWRRGLGPLLIQRARRPTEVPIGYQRAPQPSQYSFLSLAAIAVDFYLVSARRPFSISALVSLAAIALGAMLLLWGIGRALPLSLSGAILMTTGLLGVGVSALGEYVQRSYQLVQRTPFYELRTDT